MSQDNLKDPENTQPSVQKETPSAPPLDVLIGTAAATLGGIKGAKLAPSLVDAFSWSAPKTYGALGALGAAYGTHAAMDRYEQGSQGILSNDSGIGSAALSGLSGAGILEGLEALAERKNITPEKEYAYTFKPKRFLKNALISGGLGYVLDHTLDSLQDRAAYRNVRDRMTRGTEYFDPEMTASEYGLLSGITGAAALKGVRIGQSLAPMANMEVAHLSVPLGILGAGVGAYTYKDAREKGLRGETTEVDEWDTLTGAVITGAGLEVFDEVQKRVLPPEVVEQMREEGAFPEGEERTKKVLKNFIGGGVLTRGVNGMLAHVQNSNAEKAKQHYKESAMGTKHETPEQKQRAHDKRVAHRHAMKMVGGPYTLVREGSKVYKVPPKGRRSLVVDSSDTQNIWKLVRGELAKTPLQKLEESVSTKNETSSATDTGLDLPSSHLFQTRESAPKTRGGFGGSSPSSITSQRPGNSAASSWSNSKSTGGMQAGRGGPSGTRAKGSPLSNEGMGGILDRMASGLGPKIPSPGGIPQPKTPGPSMKTPAMNQIASNIAPAASISKVPQSPAPKVTTPTLNTTPTLTKVRKQSASTKLFACFRLPPYLASRFPNKSEYDDSPAHITFVYFESMSSAKEKRALSIIREEAQGMRSSQAFLHHVDTFGKGADDLYAWFMHAALSACIWELRERILSRCQKEGIPVSKKFPKWVPHATLTYTQEPRYNGHSVEGSFWIQGVDVWKGDLRGFIPFENVLGVEKTSNAVVGGMRNMTSGLFKGVGRALTFPLRASPVATTLAGTGLAAYGLDRFVGKPTYAMAKGQKYQQYKPYAPLYQTYHGGNPSASAQNPYWQNTATKTKMES